MLFGNKSALLGAPRTTSFQFQVSSLKIVVLNLYRWIACIALCCMVVLVLAFNYLGLLCGTLGYDKHASPTTRGCISNTGGTLLMA